MTEQVRDYIERYSLELEKEDGFYYYDDKIFEEDEIAILAKYDFEPDTEINAYAIEVTDTLDYIDGFDNGLHHALYYIRRLLFKYYYDREKFEYPKEIIKLKNLLSIFEMDYERFEMLVKQEILDDMEQSANRRED